MVCEVRSSESCSVAGFGITGVETSGSATAELGGPDLVYVAELA